MFLAGNHTINTTVNLTSISEITLRGERNSQVNILCLNEIGVLIQNVTILSIEGLMFLSGNTNIGIVALKIMHSNEVWIHNVGFLGSYSVSRPFTGLHITNSATITITGCYFEGNTADNGGAIYVIAGSNLALNASTIIRNSATRHGGAIYASGSNLALSDNMFSGNTASNGGAMYVIAKSNVTIRDNAFIYNRAIYHGGAIYLVISTMNIYGSTKNSSILSSEGYCRTCDMITTIPKSIPYEEVIKELTEALCATHFTNNTATHGGAMSIYSSNVLFSGSVIMFRHITANDSGGALYVDKSLFSTRHDYDNTITNTHKLFFISNRAYSLGGGISMSKIPFHAEDSNIYFLCNSANEGGGIHTRACGTLLLLGNSYFVANRASRGGAIDIDEITDELILTGDALFTENNANYGGAIFSDGHLNISGKIKFINNTAIEFEGGALHYHNRDSIIKVVEVVEFGLWA